MAVIDKRYADALLEIAISEDKCEAYLEEAVVLLKVLSENEELQSIYINPKITLEEKLSLTDSCFGGSFSADIVGLISLIVKNGRSAFLVKIFECFVAGVKEYLKIATVEVVSADTLKESQLKALEEKILATTDYKSIDMKLTVDRSLIGGLKVRIGDRIIDNTIKTKLDNMAKSLRQVNLRKDG
ncbi:MAG: ATP synthase F1 subunit delta [Clostridiales bacterium]|nr:ATP synthase F1 subunit delta [Clostridiales bacterium]